MEKGEWETGRRVGDGGGRVGGMEGRGQRIGRRARDGEGRVKSENNITGMKERGECGTWGKKKRNRREKGSVGGIKDNVGVTKERTE